VSFLKTDLMYFLKTVLIHANEELNEGEQSPSMLPKGVCVKECKNV
jgi:hypothetical protein